MGYVVSYLSGMVLDDLDEKIGYYMKESLENALYVFPIYLIIVLLSFSLNVNIMYNSKKKYSPYFQLFSFFLVFVLSFIMKADYKLEDKDLIRYLLIAITVMSALQNALPTNTSSANAGSIDRMITSIVNFILNFNWNLVIIFIPFIIVFMGAISMVVDPIKIAIVLGAIAIVVFGLLLIRTKLTHEVQVFQKHIANNVILKSSISWILSVMFYSIPLFAASYMKTGDVSKITLAIVELFNKKFGIILSVIMAVLFSLQQFVKISDDKMKMIFNMFIVLGLYVSKKG